MFNLKEDCESRDGVGNELTVAIKFQPQGKCMK